MTLTADPHEDHTRADDGRECDRGTDARSPRAAAPARTATVDTPDGPFTVVSFDGAVLASGWVADPEHLRRLIAPQIRPAQLVEDRQLGTITDAVARFYDGDASALEEVPVRQRGGPFIEHAWATLRSVPAGETVTYSQFAELAGRPAAIRAAASACARNAAALFVPCHRVLRIDGALGGFRYGLEVKKSLIDRESASAAHDDRP
ncbi:methylated-DNA--[protein]-cysteine S-methyltransferase [Gordonia jinhuaensis]|uniref:Methylated-DNA:protein-cysteine methyltransferase n=1 Tax=Gordonia jinhuaensis TaxID=1517702 RepID=A0A916TGA5_9ACTN|nr:methylated-DNA--[protein]-cysteine S-methyltransferase [Gordonia jinhuaensis]GGB43979.1 putative methylated-DNA:protein-cysteine methyltransferase [Gordonia jinhuaensis]